MDRRQPPQLARRIARLQPLDRHQLAVLQQRVAERIPDRDLEPVLIQHQLLIIRSPERLRPQQGASARRSHHRLRNAPELARRLRPVPGHARLPLVLSEELGLPLLHAQRNIELAHTRPYPVALEHRQPDLHPPRIDFLDRSDHDPACRHVRTQGLERAVGTRQLQQHRFRIARTRTLSDLQMDRILETALQEQDIHPSHRSRRQVDTRAHDPRRLRLDRKLEQISQDPVRDILFRRRRHDRKLHLRHRDNLDARLRERSVHPLRI